MADEPSEPTTIRGRARLALPASTQVDIHLEPDGLLLQGAFGDLLVPYREITLAAEQEGTRVALKGGPLEITIDLNRFADSQLLTFLLQRRIAESQRRN